jgi:putative MATE family efflux protein
MQSRPTGKYKSNHLILFLSFMKGVFSKITSAFRFLIKVITGEELDFTKMSLNMAILFLAIPMIFEMLSESLFAVVDIYFVSRLGDSNSVAVVGYTESVLSILYSVAMGLGMGATAIVARRVGENDRKGASEAAVQALYLAFAIAFVISMLGILYYKEILLMVGASQEVVDSSSSYALWMFAGNYTVTFLFLINAVFRGAGSALVAMMALFLANGLNIILDPIFIFGYGPIPAMGVEGAAIATNIGRGVGVLFQLYFLFGRGGVIQIRWETLALRANIILNVIKVSGGSILQFIIGSASWIFLMTIMSRFGENAVAGYTIAIRVFIFTLLPSWGLANAAATLVGQNLGAKHPERAEAAVWKSAYYNAFLMGFVMIVFLLFAPNIISIFSTQPEVLQYGTQALRYVSLGYIFYGYGMVVAQGLNGAGDTYTPTILNVFGFWVFQIPFAYLASIHFELGAKGVFLAIVLAETLMAIAAILIFRRGKWKEVKI